MKTRLFKLALISLLSSGLAPQGNYVSAQEWEVMTPMPTPRTGLMAAAWNKNIYVFGGATGPNASDTVEAYNTQGDSWKVCASMPTPRVAGAAETVGDKIYVIGGFNEVDGKVNVVEIYDPATNSWSTGSPMPTSRSEILSGVIGNKIYVTGGWPSEYNQLEIYDPETDTWTSGTSCPSGIIQHNSGVGYNGKFYVLGGKNYYGSEYYNSNYAYNPAGDSWSTRSEMPEELFAGDADVLNDKIHYFGGSRTNVPVINFDCHYIYDPVLDEWSTGITLLEERADHVAVTVGNSIYVIGGRLNCDTCDHITNLNERYTEPPVLGLKDHKKEVSLNIYPIPARDYIFTEVQNTDSEIKSLRITDISGRDMLQESFKEERRRINVSGYPAGIYTIMVTTAKGTASQNIILGK